MKAARLAVTLLILLGAIGTVAEAQVRVEGDVNHPANRLLSEILARDSYLLLERDTVLPADFHAAGDVLIVRADVRLEGRIDGSVAVVHGVFFTRPGSVVRGEIASIGGEVYLSGLAEAGAVHELPLQVETRLTREAGGQTITLVPPALPARVGTTGVFGVGLPTYDRANGLTLRWGAEYRLRRDSIAPVLRGSVSFATARSAPGGTLALEIPVSGSGWLRAEVARESYTNEAWIRGAFMNSLSVTVLRSDLRDYHESDVALLGWERRQRQPLISGERFFAPRLTLRASRDRSLRTRNVWSAFGSGEWRENPEIDEGVLVSVVPGGFLDWRGRTSRFAGDLSVEWAPPGASDFEFVQLVADGRYEMLALRGHVVTLRGRTQQSLGDDPAPRQRWSFVGGPGTLPTLPTAAMYGDRLVFVQTTYDVPLPWVQVPLVGSPSLRATHATGAAWPTGAPMPAWEQNVGAGLRFFLLEVIAHVDPTDPGGGVALGVGVGFEF